jgi:serine/threonine-protein kinase
MADLPEQSLLHYRLVEKIGEGGMGVVWKAVDSTLNRDVAIKVLPDVFAGDTDRLARFEREARLLASLNHPNIAGIYGIHESEGTRFLAMELIEGDDLSERLAQGALSRDEALRVSLQIAQALEAAHENGVIHRDLKPANVKLAANGTAKVLDFGLAKALVSDAAGESSPSMSPTLTSAGTVAGMILGTASYMSPEQAKGQEVDRRSDIWSFGVVLFEMLCGRRLFHSETVSETMAAVMMKEIEWGALPTDTPARVRRLLQRCLQRDPNSRLRDIGDARIALEEALAAPDEPQVVAQAATRRSSGLALLPWLIAAASLVTLGVVWWSSGTGQDSPGPVMRFSLPIPEEQQLTGLILPAMTMSPDGTSLVFVGEGESDTLLYMRHINQQEVVPIHGTDGAMVPVFSPDGEWLAFFDQGTLKKISVHGGPPMTLCDAPDLRGLAWGADGTIVFTPRRSTGIMRVSDAGGTPQEITKLEFEEGSYITPSHRWPEILPGGNTVLYTSTANDSQYVDAEIVAVSLHDGAQRTLVRGGTHPRYVPAGFLVYTRGNTLFAARFDPDKAELTGSAVPVLENVSASPAYGSANFTFSSNGTLVYLPKISKPEDHTLVWLDREGNETPASAHAREYRRGTMSPDGKQYAMGIVEDETENIWILEFERDTLNRLTFDPVVDRSPSWSPDGEWIVYASFHDGASLNLFRKRANGTGEAERLTTSESHHYPRSWLPDGSAVAFEQLGGDTTNDLLLLRMEPEPTSEIFLRTPFFESGPEISPDGRWIAYESNLSGTREVYVRPLSGPGGQSKVSTNGGIEPQWAPDRPELVYVSPDEKLMSVGYSVEGDTFRPQLPRALFDFSDSTFASAQVEFAPDGSRMLVTKDAEEDQSAPRNPTVVVNWFDELEAKVPVEK